MKEIPYNNTWSPVTSSPEWNEESPAGNPVKTIMELGKVRISAPVALSALTGYVLYTGQVGARGVILALSVFFIACSSSAINHWQERDTDALMPRTRKRPIPSGKISPAYAFAIAMAFFVTGSALIISIFPIMAWTACFITLLAYNIFYTPLKRITAFAVVPGSMVGALPPYAGWIAAGGEITDNSIFLVTTFFFIGQIPHFWLLLLMFGREYRLAGLPSLNDIFDDSQIMRLSYTWILAAIASALIVAWKVMTNHIIISILLLYIAYLLYATAKQQFTERTHKPGKAFLLLNLLYLLMMALLIIDNLS